MARPYCVTKLIDPALAEIKPVYYPGEERLVSLDVLKLNRGEDIIRPNPEDTDPDKWLDKGELTELPEVHRTEAEDMLGNKAVVLVTSEMDNGLYLELPIIPEEPENIALREGIHERIQAEIRHEDKEMAEEILEDLPAWNEVPDLMMETE